MGACLTKAKPIWMFPDADGKVVVPEGIVHLKSGAFANQKELKSIVLPDSLKSIGNRVFMGCSGLTKVWLPDSVEYLGKDRVFYDCSSLKEIVFPDSFFPNYASELGSEYASCFRGTHRTCLVTNKKGYERHKDFKAQMILSRAMQGTLPEGYVW